MTAIPQGKDLIPTKTAGEIIGLSAQGVRDLVHKGDLHADGLYKIGPRETYFFERATIETYKRVREERLAAASARTGGTNEKAPKKPHIRGSSQALLERLKSCAVDGFVDGNATDIITGTPATPQTWDDINALTAAGLVEWELDNWDRLTFRLLDVKEEEDGRREV